MAISSESAVLVHTRGGKTYRAQVVKPGEIPIYLDETGKFCLKIGEQWLRLATMRAAELEIAKQAKVLRCLAISDADAAVYDIIEIVSSPIQRFGATTVTSHHPTGKRHCCHDRN